MENGKRILVKFMKKDGISHKQLEESKELLFEEIELIRINKKVVDSNNNFYDVSDIVFDIEYECFLIYLD